VDDVWFPSPLLEHQINLYLHQATRHLSIRPLQKQLIIICHFVPDEILHDDADSTTQRDISPITLRNSLREVSHRKVRAARMVLPDVPLNSALIEPGQGLLR
jgi:hypothetical protein